MRSGRSRSRRSSERGTAMVVMMIVMVALGTIAGLTVISVQGGAATTSAHRFSAMALYAAESGAAVTMEWLRGQWAGVPDRFTHVINQSPLAIPGNGIAPGAVGNLLSNDQQGWYEVALRNNTSDPAWDKDPVNDKDSDGVVLIEVTGHGPNGAMKRLEWEVKKDETSSSTALVLLGWRDVL